MDYTIIFEDYAGFQYSELSNSSNLHQDLINLFSDEYNVIKVFVDEGGVYATGYNCPIKPNVIECDFQ